MENIRPSYTQRVYEMIKEITILLLDCVYGTNFFIWIISSANWLYGKNNVGRRTVFRRKIFLFF